MTISRRISRSERDFSSASQRVGRQPPKQSIAHTVRSFFENWGGLHPAWMMTWLVVLCVVSRCVMTLCIDAVCDDAYYYAAIAKALANGEFDYAFENLSLNVYPFIVVALRSFVPDWISAGRFWAIVASCLLVLPLFGWVRCLYGARAAAAACFLYAVHPDLIELGIEPIREPTFWLFFVLSLYLLHRAATENTWPLYVLAGFSVFLAIHTRTEGWLLIVPLIGSSLVRLGDRSARRSRLIAGPLVSLAMIPILLVAVNYTVLKAHPRGEWGRLGHLQLCLRWLNNASGAQKDLLPSAGADPAVDRSALLPIVDRTELSRITEAAAKQGSTKVEGDFKSTTARRPTAELVETSHRLKYVKALLRTSEPLTFVCVLVGLLLWRRDLWRRDTWFILPLWFSILLAVWIYNEQNRAINGRYFYTVFFLVVPFGGLGLLVVIQSLRALVGRFVSSERATLAAVAALVLLTAVNWGDAFTSRHERRQREADFGRWLQLQYGPFGSIVGDWRSSRVGYYAMGDIAHVNYSGRSVGSLIEQKQPEAVIHSSRNSPPEMLAAIRAQARRFGLQQIAKDALPTSGDGFEVFLKETSHPTRPSGVARRPPAGAVK